MGREVKRVALDFEWPRKKVWSGFLRPDALRELPCPEGDDCYNGSTVAREWVAVIAQLLLTLDDDRDAQRRGQAMHPHFASLPGPTSQAHSADLFDPLRQGRSHPVLRPGPDIAEFGTGLAGRAAGFMGHDAINSGTAENKLIEAAGLDPTAWGMCPTCGGHATVEAYPGQRAESEAWERTEPSTGDGWQLWETTSAGSPISAVFATAEELARWLTTAEGGNAVGFGGQGAPMTYGQALGFVSSGSSPTAFMNAGGLHDGAHFVGSEAALGDRD